jgi:hypothetical protein
MKKISMIAAAALLAVSVTGAAFAQAGGNPNAPEPNSSGTGIVKPGTDKSGTAVDPSMKKGKMHKGKKAKKSSM